VAAAANTTCMLTTSVSSDCR